MKCSLSRGWRLILVNVLATSPLYFISFSHLPKWVIHAINCTRRAFFWKYTKDIDGDFVLWISSLYVLKKYQSGLGVCNITVFNFAPLSKWWRRLFHDAHFLWATLVLYNYYRRRRVYDTQPSLHGHTSPFWRGVLEAIRSLLWALQLNKCGSTTFWLDQWVSDDILVIKFPNLFILAFDPSVTTNG